MTQPDNADNRLRTSVLTASTIGVAALAWFAIHEQAWAALAVYVSTAVTSFLPGPLWHLGKVTVFAAFVLACTGGHWMTATMIAAITGTRYLAYHLALHTATNRNQP